MVLSISFGVATWVATSVLNQTLQKAGRDASAPLDGGADFCVSNGDAGVPRELADELKRLPGIRAVRPLVIHRITLPELNQQPALLIGTDLAGGDTGQWHVTINELTPRVFVRSVVLGQRPVLIGREIAKLLPPDSTELTLRVAGKVHRLHCTGVVDASGRDAIVAGNTVVTECEAAAGLVGRPDLVTRHDVYLASGADRADVQRRLEEEVRDRAGVFTPEGYEERTQEMMSGVKIGMALCGGAALVVGLFLVYNTLAVAGISRRHDIGILRSIGATRSQILRLLLTEAAFLGVVGTTVGIPLGVALAQLLLAPAQHVMSDVFVALHTSRVRATLGSFVSAAAAGIATTLLAAIAPSARLCLETPVHALQRLAPGQALSRRLLMAIGLCLVASGLVCFTLRDQLPHRAGTFGSLVLILAGALVASPLVSEAASRLIQSIVQPVLGIASGLAAGNLVRASGRVAVVIAALAAGTALLLQTAGLIRSNETAVRAWVDQCLAGDLFVTSGGPLSASGQALPMPDALGQELEAAQPGIRAVPMRFRYLDWEHAGRTTRVLLTALDAQAYYEANRGRLPLLPDLDLYRALGEPGNALVSENFAALYGVRAGDQIALRGSSGPVKLSVLGAVADYSCNRGTVLIDRARYRDQFDAGLVDVYDVYLDKGHDLESARDGMQRSSLAADHRLTILTHHELRGHILAMLERLYGLAYTQEAVVAVVALLGVVAALMISVLQRRRELGVLRALGATRAFVFRSIVAEGLLIGAVGTMIGLVVGVPLEWFTVRVLLYEESGFLCPVLQPWTVMGALVCLMFTGIFAAGVAPGICAARDNIVQAVAYE
jgi:putative ABC transport system permease protein